MWTRIDVVTALTASVGIVLGVTGAPDPSPARPDSAPPVAVSFTEDIFPIFEKSCIGCHGGTDEDGFEIVEAGLYLTSYEGVMAGSEYGSVIDPGDEESLLLVMVEDQEMPDEGDPLTEDQIELIRAWILEGAQEKPGEK